MNKKLINKLLSISLLSLATSTHGLQASEIDIQWLEIENYRDIDSGYGGQKRYEARVQTELNRQFTESAQAALPSNQTLYLEITDLDLAGRIDYFYSSTNPLRVVRQIDYPRIKFSYEVRDENNIVLSSGSENIKDMGFLQSYSYRASLNTSSFPYEKALINDWFKETF